MNSLLRWVVRGERNVTSTLDGLRADAADCVSGRIGSSKNSTMSTDSNELAPELHNNVSHG